MSVQSTPTYNPEAVVLAINGVPIDGLAEDGITIEREAKSEWTDGMDGGGHFNFNASRACRVTVQVRAASAGAQRLSTLQRAAYTAMHAGSAHPTYPGMAYDPVNGSWVSTGAVFFMNEPLPNFQMQAGVLEFEMIFPNYSEARASNLTV